jgi:hypothetical protein
MLIEDLDHLGEVRQRPSQPIDLVDDDDIDTTIADIIEKRTQRRPIHGRTREPAVIVAFANQHPALVPLALNIGLASLALRIEAVELLIETFLGRFSRVDAATKLSVAHQVLTSR